MTLMVKTSKRGHIISYRKVEGECKFECKSTYMLIKSTKALNTIIKPVAGVSTF